jgi:hypothetical protein
MAKAIDNIQLTCESEAVSKFYVPTESSNPAKRPETKYIQRNTTKRTKFELSEETDWKEA